MYTGKGRRWPLAVALLAAFVSLVACAPLGAGSATEAAVSKTLAAVRDEPPLLREFLQAMPKGGDIHNHLVGAVYAESYVRWAAEDGKCISTTTWVVSLPPCGGDAVPASGIQADDSLRDKAIDAWSMRSFVPSAGFSGHDQFFSTFARFDPAGTGREGDMLAEVAQRSRAQQLQYLELMLTPASAESWSLAGAIPWTDDLTANMNAALAAPELTAAVIAGVAEISAAEDRMRSLLSCSTPPADPACEMSVRYQSQANRLGSPAQVLARLVTGFRLAETDHRFVGVNLISVEDDLVAMADYPLHMRMLEVLHTRFPDVKIALHAGELTLGLVPPEGLTSHIRQAVTTGHASRIGHGVDISYEPGAPELIAYMAEQGIAVEVLLSSNAETLQVEGARHPFMSYRQAGVTTILGTDDQGVSRSDITNEYQRAVESYGLSYADLKRMARSSLEWAFVEGESLWRSPNFGIKIDECADEDPAKAPSRDCQELLDRSPKAAAQWRLEADFVAFESWAPRRFRTATRSPSPVGTRT